MATIAANIQQVRQRMAQACAAAQRPAQSVTLLAVSKTFNSDAIRLAHAAGLRCFGENYVQEGLDKIAALADLRAQIEWHLLGPLQSNKTRHAAQAFDWVHSIDRLGVAHRLSEQRPADVPPLQLCLQVNIDAASGKSGVAPHEAAPLAQALAALPRLRLRGLMAIPDPAHGAAPYRALRELLGVLQSQGLMLDTLSMGMSADLEAAIAEGATVVRVGRAIFGERGAASTGADHDMTHPGPHPSPLPLRRERE